jgi:hypothetical protein
LLDRLVLVTRNPVASLLCGACVFVDCAEKRPAARQATHERIDDSHPLCDQRLRRAIAEQTALFALREAGLTNLVGKDLTLPLVIRADTLVLLDSRNLLVWVSEIAPNGSGVFLANLLVEQSAKGIVAKLRDSRPVPDCLRATRQVAILNNRRGITACLPEYLGCVNGRRVALGDIPLGGKAPSIGCTESVRFAQHNGVEAVTAKPPGKVYPMVPVRHECTAILALMDDDRSGAEVIKPLNTLKTIIDAIPVDVIAKLISLGVDLDLVSRDPLWRELAGCRVVDRAIRGWLLGSSAFTQRAGLFANRCGGLIH